MDSLVDMAPSVLASLLESLEDCEGVLVCRDQLADWEEESVARCFATFQFQSFASGDDGLRFTHVDSGTSITYSGVAVRISVGGDLPEALPDLLRTLGQLGWCNMDVYSQQGDALYEDLARLMPASVDIQMRLCEVPTEMSSDLRAFSAEVEKAGTGGTSTQDFLRVFREESGLPPVTAPEEPEFKPVNPGAQVNDQIGVARNYVPDVNPFDMAPQVPGGATEAVDMPVEATAVPKRPIIRLNSASPVMSAPAAGQPVSAPVPAPVQPAAGLPDEPGNGVRVTVAAAAPVTSPVVPEPKASEPAAELKAVTPAAFFEPEFPGRIAPPSPALLDESFNHAMLSPKATIQLGAATIVVDAPWHRLSDEDIASVGSGRSIVRVEPGHPKQQMASWALGDEIPVEADGWRVGQALASALWPMNTAAQVVALAALLTLKARSTTPVTLDDLRTAANNPGWFASPEVDLALSTALTSISVPVLAETWARIFRDLWSKPSPSSLESAPAPMSFRRLLDGDDDRVFVLTLDDLDLGTAAEFEVAGMLRFAQRLAGSRRLRAPVKEQLSQAEREAAEVLQRLAARDPDAVARLLRLKN